MVKKVFIVDDEQSIRKILESAFKKAGYETASAESGEKALEILDKEKIQVIFLDLKLPGMNGIELCRMIKKNNPVACIFAMTGFSSIFDLTECRDAGFEDYFIKPIDLGVFIKTAEMAFEKLARWKKK
jgi:DNA-binding response OmpR family regulator